ncbi:MAG: toprim domain-containing protein [Planctomycetes bacterium]|nr:toprim domain-containing protein [Planctomycetota bacterium]
MIARRRLGWNGSRITIPIQNRAGEVAFFKLAKDPEDHSPSPKMLAPRGVRYELYGWDSLLRRPEGIVICEGEFDRLVLEAQGLPAVTSTGGAGTFRRDWIQDFEGIKAVYICFDRDEAGRRGALRVGGLIAHAKVVTLPEEAGEGGDVTDFFVRLGRSREDFEKLQAAAPPVPPDPEVASSRTRTWRASDPSRERIERIKRDVPIADVIGQRLELWRSGSVLVGRCPFHEDRQPSLAVYPETRTFYCFGCYKHGDVITFVRELNHLSFPEALDALEKLIPHHDREPR